MNTFELKQKFFNSLWRCDEEFANEYWKEFLTVRRIVPDVSIKSFTAYALEMWEHSEALKQW